MQALRLEGDRVRVVDAPVPEPTADTAIVRVSLAGVCNTDLELVKGYLRFRGILGHEFVGTIEEGPGEWKGQRVVGEINFACESCRVCMEGLQRHCPSRRVMGILDANGCFAEYVQVPIANLHTVPDRVPDEVAVFTEPLAAAFEVLEQVHVEPGRDCVVLGDGKLGLLIAQVLHGAGARVVCVGRHASKLEILARRDIETVLAEDWTPEPTSIVVEATGTAEGFERAVAATKPRGTLVLKSTVGKRPKIDLSPLVVNEIKVVGSRCGPFPPALRALELGSVDVRSLVSDRVPLARADEALRRATDHSALKVLLEPGSGDGP
jgi:threonine dehydrogenase-like Zn-dependent dehydrogenase